MSPRHVPASITELQRIGLFGSLSGEKLNALAQRMMREEMPAGRKIVGEDAETDRFCVLLSGLAGVTYAGGGRGVLRPGDTFGKLAPLAGSTDAASVTAMTTCVVASCDRATFDELVRPLLAEG